MGDNSNLVLNASNFDQQRPSMPPNPPGATKLLSNDVSDTVEYVTAILMFVINIVAVATNTINIRVFLKQRYRSESTTLTLLCLSVIDLVGSIFLLPLPCCFLLKILYPQSPGLYLSCHTFTLLSSTAIHEICSYSATWVTVYMSIERSLCVLLPLKVKLLITPKTSLIVILSICAVFTSANITALSHLKITWTRHPFLGFSFAFPYKSALAADWLYMMNVVVTTSLNSVALVIVSIATALMVYKLNQTRKWRKAAVGAHQNEGKGIKMNKNNFQGNTIDDDLKSVTSSKLETTSRDVQNEINSTVITHSKSNPRSDLTSKDRTQTSTNSSKDVEAMKTVCIVTSIFLVCLSIGHIPSSVIYWEPSITFNGPNGNLINMVATVKYFFGSVNACVNFFFFLRMSSRYQAVFYSLYPRFSK